MIVFNTEYTQDIPCLTNHEEPSQASVISNNNFL